MKSRFIALALSFIIAAGCSSFKVKSMHDEAADFDSYTTYRWGFPRRAAGMRVSPSVERAIKSAVDAQLKLKGFVFFDSTAADIIIAYHVGLEERINIDPETIEWYTWDFAYPRSTTYEFDQGTLVVDMVDAGEEELVWRGWGEVAINKDTPNPDKINEYVAKIFEKYPPPPPKPDSLKAHDIRP